MAGKEELDTAKSVSILAPASLPLLPTLPHLAPGRLGVCLGPVCAGRPRHMCSALVCAKAGCVPDALMNVLKRRKTTEPSINGPADVV